MADGKNSIIVYRDWKNIFDELSDEEAGKLIKHFFAYVNDLNPELEDKYLRMAFLPIKDALKRDLKHWESVKERRSESGRIGGLKSGESRSKSKQNEANEANASKTKQNEANEAVIVNDSVIVSDNVNEEKKYTKRSVSFPFKKSLIEIGVDEQVASDWLIVRNKKKASNTETAFNAIKKQIELSGLPANECIKMAAEKSWTGFDAKWLENDKTLQNNGANRKPYKPGDRIDPNDPTIFCGRNK